MKTTVEDTLCRQSFLVLCLHLHLQLSNKLADWWRKDLSLCAARAEQLSQACLVNLSLTFERATSLGAYWRIQCSLVGFWTQGTQESSWTNWTMLYDSFQCVNEASFCCNLSPSYFRTSQHDPLHHHNHSRPWRVVCNQVNITVCNVWVANCSPFWRIFHDQAVWQTMLHTSIQH